MFNYIVENRDEFVTKLDTCFNQISEANLSRIWEKSKENDFAIISAYRKSEDKQTNVINNRNLRHELNEKKLGVYSLVGHWRECQDSTIPYDKCPKDKLIDVVERSYFVPRNPDVSPQEFKELLFNLAKKYKQDGIVLRVKEFGLNGVYDSKTEQEFANFQKGITFNKVSQAYSQYVKKMNVPFIFEGIEYPECLGIGKEAYRKNGFLW